jgi:high-affinity iron transporter
MWDDVFPSFLIGLREGLEAGLIVSILVATLVRADARSRLPQVWTGVLAAIAVAMSCGAVLTFTAANLSATAQEAFGGALSVIAVVFVTAMVFWMRRSARTLSGEIREKVTAALSMGAGMLIVTSFLAVGREGLETALFLWTAAQSAGESTGPVVGAGIGLLLAAGLCWGLYRRVLKINLARFFTVTGAVLIVIASGVLGYGLRDLQEGGVLPGRGAFAFDLSQSIDAGSWYSTLLQGIFNLQPSMTWLQVVAYGGYLAVAMTLFIRGVRAPAAKPTPAEAVPAALAPAEAVPAGLAPAQRETARSDSEVPEPESGPTPRSQREQKSAGPRRRPVWLLPGVVVAVPAVIAGTVVVLSGGKQEGVQTIQVSATHCGKGFTAPKPGRQTFRMHNTGDKASEVYLIDPAGHAVYGEIEGLAPGITRDLVATVGRGEYAWRCVPTSGKAVTSSPVHVSGGGSIRAVAPVSEKDLIPALAAYKSYVDKGLGRLVGQTQKLSDDITGGDLKKARADWLTAHITYSSLGAAYGTFEDFDQKINGRADGLPQGVEDADFTGFHRLEYGLWHGRSAAGLKASAAELAKDCAGLKVAFPRQNFDVSELPLRTHEILENTLQFELTGDTDQGSGTNLATAEANLAGTRELINVLSPLLGKRDAKLLPTVHSDMTRVQKLLDSAHHSDSWTSVDALDAATRAELDGATGQLLEDLAPIPDLLETRKSA